MCTLVILRRPDHDWPLIFGANRDESLTPPVAAPARHWPDRDEVVAGLDILAGGSWMGINDHGVTAAVLNRHDSLGPAPDKRSRGELVLEALDHADAGAAADALEALDPAAYRPFNLVVADNRDAFLLVHRGDRPIERAPVPDGLHVLTSGALDDPQNARIRRYRSLFDAATAPDIDPQPWIALLSDEAPTQDDAAAAMCFRLPGGFGTVSSSILMLPAAGLASATPVWRFATVGVDGPGPFLPLPLD